MKKNDANIANTPHYIQRLFINIIRKIL